MRIRLLGAVGMVTALIAVPVKAAPDGENRSVLSFQSENDLYGDGHDRWYTNGFRLALSLAPDDRPKALSWISKLLPLKPKNGRTDLFAAIGQNMYTPDDITLDVPSPDDRFYAGWAYLELGVSGSKDHLQETLTLSLGTTGPPALAEETQSLIHNIVGVPEPQGWDTQLRTEPTIQVFYERAWFYDLARIGDHVMVDTTPRVGLDVGTVFVEVNGGVLFRIGNYLPRALPPRINPSATGAGKVLRSRPDGTGWFLFAGAEMRTVAHNLFLDGSLFRSDRNLDKKFLLYEIHAGFALSFDRFAFTYSYVRRSREFGLQDEAQGFGSINFSIAF